MLPINRSAKNKTIVGPTYVEHTTIVFGNISGSVELRILHLE
jgi:hypothetical protein